MTQQNAITPRSLRFEQIDHNQPFWNGGCPVRTHFMNAIILAAPMLERLAISAMVPFKETIKEPHLAKAVADFMSQEGAHSREFLRISRTLQAQGYPARALQKAQHQVFKRWANRFSPEMHLSFTCAVEHVIALFSERVLLDAQWLENAWPPYAAMYRWHSIEEIEHKAVAFDVYKSIKAGYWRRCFGMLFMSCTFGFSLMFYFFTLCHHDRIWRKKGTIKKALSLILGKKGIVRTLWKPYWAYYKPSFHPWQNDNKVLIDTWQQRLAESATAEAMVDCLSAAE